MRSAYKLVVMPQSRLLVLWFRKHALENIREVGKRNKRIFSSQLVSGYIRRIAGKQLRYRKKILLVGFHYRFYKLLYLLILPRRQQEAGNNVSYNRTNDRINNAVSQYQVK